VRCYSSKTRYYAPVMRRRGWIAIGAVTVLAFLIALHDQRLVAHNSCCDMTSYTDQGLDFARNGLFGSSHRFMSLRTYGYPFFVGWLSRLTNGDPAHVEVIVFVAQLLMFLTVAWALASIFARLIKCSRVALYAVIVLNPVLLAATPAVLSDLLAALLVTLSVALVFYDGARRPAVAFASLVLASCGAMVRPASVVFVPVVLVLWIACARWLRGVPLRAWPTLVVGAVLPFVPQVINNVRLFDRATPLIVEHLYADQTVWGMKFLKYGTLIPAAPLNYLNPWYDGSSPTFFAWLTSHPLRALGTAAMHLFALFDQDFAFTYIHNRHPWYRWPLGAASFGYVFIGVAMLGTILVRCWRRRRLGRIGFFALAVLGASGGYLLLYLPTAVETRFSQPIYLLLAPFVVLGVAAFLRSASVRQRMLWSVALVAFVGACLALSFWLAQQAFELQIAS
jgi:hypothetical protein